MAIHIPEEEELQEAEIFLSKQKKDYCTYQYYGGLRRHDKVVVDVDLNDYVKKDLIAAILTVGETFSLVTIDDIFKALRTCAKLEVVKDPTKIYKYKHLGYETIDHMYILARTLAEDCQMDIDEIETIDDLKECTSLILNKFGISIDGGE